MTLEEKVKKLSKTKDDDLIETMIPLLVEHIKNNYNYDEVIDEETGEVEEEKITGSMIMFISKVIDYYNRDLNIDSEQLGDYNISFNKDLPEDIKNLLMPKARFL